MTPGDVFTIPLQLGDIIPTGSRVVTFEVIFGWFMLLGTLVGIVVITYMLWNAYKYRATGDDDKYADERPEIGEIPQGGGKGRKLFLSFGMSAVIVISLILWTYGAVLYVEQPAQQVAEEQNTGEPVEITVTGYQFGWDYEYTEYDAETSTMVIPADRPISLRVTSRDVWHNFGIPEFRVKSDAIPGEFTTAWFIAEETGEYQAKCYELCGGGHSGMVDTVRVVDEDEWENWKAENLETEDGDVAASGDEERSESGDDGRITGQGTPADRTPTAVQSSGPGTAIIEGA